MNKIIFPKKKLQPRRLKGSNQYVEVFAKKRTQPTGKAYLASVTLVVMLAYVAMPPVAQFIEDISFKPAYAPTVQRAYAEPIKPTATPTPTEKDEIDAYIRQIFGKDANKAFKLLSCENASHKPNRVNTAGNYPVGSRDIGVFQINEFHQGVNAKFLFDWKLNVDIAHKIYVDSGNSFKMWSCGKRFGI